MPTSLLARVGERVDLPLHELESLLDLLLLRAPLGDVRLALRTTRREILRRQAPCSIVRPRAAPPPCVHLRDGFAVLRREALAETRRAMD